MKRVILFIGAIPFRSSWSRLGLVFIGVSSFFIETDTGLKWTNSTQFPVHLRARRAQNPEKKKKNPDGARRCMRNMENAKRKPNGRRQCEEQRLWGES